MRVIFLMTFILISFLSFSQNIQSDSDIIFIDSKESLNEQLEHLDNNIIFFDIWSVICSPCIEQFKYLKDLDYFFENNEIVTLSLCVSPEYNIEKWKELIYENNVHGYHIFVTSSSIEKYKQGFDIEEKYLIPLGHNFPYYILIAKNGTATKLDYLPSEKDKLIEQISKFLN